MRRRSRAWSRWLVGIALALVMPAMAAASFPTLVQFDPLLTGAPYVVGIDQFDWASSGSIVFEDALVSSSTGATTLRDFFDPSHPNTGVGKPGSQVVFRFHANQRLEVLRDPDGNPISAPDLVTTGSGSGYEVTFTGSGTETALFDGTSILTFVSIDGEFFYWLDHTPDSVNTTGSGFRDGESGIGGAPFLRGSFTAVAGQFLATGPGQGFGGSTITSVVTSYDPNIISPYPAASGLGLVGTSFSTTVQPREPSTIGVGGLIGGAPNLGIPAYIVKDVDQRWLLDGNSTFSADYVTAAIGDFVWEDLNANGIQEDGEPGIAGVTVELYECADEDTLFDTTVTDQDGGYLFDDLTPGCYFLQFVKPAGYVFTAAKQGGDIELDSDADPDGGTASITLAPGQTDLTWDAGLYRQAALGDRVWEDLNGNGLQDAGEPGVPGVTVELYVCDGVLIATTTTDDEGLYLFTGLMPGSYRVVFAAPTGYEFTTQNVGMDEAIDSDADDFGVTACVTLASGGENRDVDAGLVAIQYAAIGDFVWEDLNRNGIQDAGEPGIAGVLVELHDCAGNKLDEMLTDENGKYLFDNLLAGDYKLRFTAPADYFFTLQNQGGDPEKDSDADSNGWTVCTTLDPGETDRSWDAGLWTPMPAIDIEKATNGQDADDPTGPFIPVGDPVVWTYVVTNTGNVPLHDVTVTDDQGVEVTCPQTTLAVGEFMTCTATGTALLGQYANLGTVVGYDDYGNEVTDADPSHYYGKMDAPGTGTPGYWKNHPNAWPVDQLTIGGETYTKDMAIGLMGCPDGNKLFTVFRALVAAKLNVLVGNDASCIAVTIEAADAWMAEYGPMPTACRGNPKVRADSYAWTIGEPLYWLLDDYNNGLLCAPSRDSME